MKQNDLTQQLVALCSLAACVCLALCSDASGQEAQSLKSRHFLLDYGAKLEGVPAGSQVRVWLPVPTSDEHQTVEVVETRFPKTPKETSDRTFGNKILYFETEASRDQAIDFNTRYEVTRKEVRRLDGNSVARQLSEADRKKYLSANRLVPVTGRPLELLAGVKLDDDPIKMARTLYDLVDRHVRYDKSKPGYGNGDAVWVCDSRFGNCTDFHSLYIALARANGLPARFEIGFPLPLERGAGDIGGYHCWALFYTEANGWVPVDISEADKHPEMKEYYFGNLSENRVTFSTGRDIELEPAQAGPPLNYFVYPYVEVDGKPWPKDKIKLAFAFEDISKSK